MTERELFKLPFLLLRETSESYTVLYFVPMMM